MLDGGQEASELGKTKTLKTIPNRVFGYRAPGLGLKRLDLVRSEDLEGLIKT